MNSFAGFDNPYAIIGAVFLVIVIALTAWTLLRPKRPTASPQPALASEPSPSDEELEYLDSSHIISGPLVGRDGARVVREPPAAARDPR
jgi:hypothetical protein